MSLLVGREHESSLLRAALDRAMTGRGGSILVSGESGIGKTTLVRALATEARARGAHTLFGACYDLTATPPYGLWRDLIARAASALDAVSPLAPLADDAAWERAADVGSLIRQMREVVVRLARESVLVVVLEDLHWADAPSLELLRDLVRRLDALPALVLATYRGDEIGRDHPLFPLIPAMVREGAAERVELRPLSNDALTELVDRDHPGLTPDERRRLVRYLVEHAEGNALYVTELLRSLEETGALRRVDERWQLEPLDRAEVPSLLRQVIDGRVSRLGEQARRPLEVAAVIGQEVSLAVWSMVAGLDENGLLDVIEPAVGAKVLTASTSAGGVAFAHALIRQTIYDGILAPRRSAWHRAAGEALAASPHADPDRVAHHFRESGDARAVEWLIRAGERAQRSYAILLAAERFSEAAVALARHDPHSPERGWLLYRGGRGFRFADAARAIELLEAALAAATDTKESLLEAYCRFDLGSVHCNAGDINHGVSMMEEALSAIAALPLDAHREAGRTAWLADALLRREEVSARSRIAGANAELTRAGTLAIWNVLTGRFELTRELSGKYSVLSDKELLSDPLVTSAAGDAFWGLGYAEAQLGEPSRATRAFERARLMHERGEHYAMLAGVFATQRSEVAHPFHPTDRALHGKLRMNAQRAANRAEAAVHGSFRLDQYFPELLEFAGDWDAAIRVARDAHDSREWELWNAGSVVKASVARWRGEAEPTRWIPPELHVVRAGELTTPFFSPMMRALTLCADVAMDAGDLSTASEWIARHHQWIESTKANRHRPATQLLWSRLFRLHGNWNEAETAARSAIALASDPMQPAVRASALRSLGESLIALERHHEAASALEESIRVFDACEAPFERARGEVELARVCGGTGRSEKAQRLLAAARLVSERLGARGLLDRIDQVERELALSTDIVSPPPAGLSTREVEVLRLVATGMTNAEVAAELSISDRTVGQHLRSIFEKIDVSTRAAATRWAVDHHLT